MGFNQQKCGVHFFYQQKWGFSMDFRGFDIIEASNPKNSPPALGMRIVALAQSRSQIFGSPK
jgi:hypothetical protein